MNKDQKDKMNREVAKKVPRNMLIRLIWLVCVFLLISLIRWSLSMENYIAALTTLYIFESSAVEAVVQRVSKEVFKEVEE